MGPHNEVLVNKCKNEEIEMVKPACKGTVEQFRYADDGVICCQYEADAERIRQTLGKRLEKFKLQLNEENSPYAK